MADVIVCNVCLQEITNQAEQVDRIYQIKGSGKTLPPQKKHDSCDASYAAQKIGLQKISS